MSRPPSPAPPPRYEREIEHLLRRGRPVRRRWRFPRLRRPTFRPDWQMAVLTALGLFLAAFFLRYSVPWASRGLVLVGTALLLLGYAGAFSRPPRRYEKKWRGQVIDLPPAESPWRNALRRFFRRGR